MARAKKVKYNYYGYNAAGEIYAYSYNEGTAGIKVYNFSGDYLSTGWNGTGVVVVGGKRSALDSSGNFYITDGNTCKKYNPSGVLQWSYDIGVPTNDVCVDGTTGDVYFTHRRGAVGYGVYERITRLDSDGNFQQKYSTVYISVNGAGSMDLDSSGNIYYTYYEAPDYVKILKDGTLAWRKTIPGSPSAGYGCDVYVDTSNNNYIYSSGGRIRKYDSDGNLLMEFTTNVPATSYTDERNNIIVDYSGNIIVHGRSVANNIAKFDSSGNLIWAKTSQGGGEGRGIDVDINGNVYVSTSNAFTNSISRYAAADGTLEWTNTTATSPLVINTRPIG